MSEFEQSGFRGLWLPGRRLHGGFGVALIAKRSFSVDMAAGHCVPAEGTPAFVMAAEYRNPDNPAGSSVVRPPEMALAKEKVDVIVQGVAHAPGGKPKRSFEVRVRIGKVLDKALHVVGPRKVTWVKPKKTLTKKQRDKGESQPFPLPTFGQAKAISSLPLTYEYAYGGAAALLLDAHLQEAAEAEQAKAEAVEARRARKQEIEDALREEQAREAQEAQEAEDAEAGGLSAVSDDKAKEQFEAAFTGGEGPRKDGVALLDEEAAQRLGQQEAEALVEASPMRLRAERPEASGEPEEGVEEEVPVEATPRAEGTAVLDVVDFEGQDELQGALDKHDAERRRQLRDAEGTYIARDAESEAVSLSDDGWIEAAKADEAPAAPADEESPYPMIPSLANPSGRGYCVSPHKEAVDGVLLPSIEYPDRRITPETFVRDLREQDLSAIEAAAGFGAYGAGWYPRARLAGVMPWDQEAAETGKAEALKAFDADDPNDQAAIEAIKAMEIPVMQPGWFQEAHPEMQISGLRGDEEVYLDNFSPAGPIFFRLPGLHPSASIDLGQGALAVSMQIDTLIIDAETHDAPVVTILWRGWHPLKSLEVFAEVQNVEVLLSELDQEGWLDAERRRAAEGVADRNAPDLLEEVESGVVADEAYREDVHLGATPSVGDGRPPKAEGGTAILDVVDERALTDDAFFDKVQSEKAAFEAEAEARAADAEQARERALKERAREMVDAELEKARTDGEE